MAYSMDPISANCYPGTAVLINKFVIREEARLKEHSYFKGLSHDEFVVKLVDFYCVTNDLHPFREGNGRTQRAFLTQLIPQCGV